MDCRPPVDRGHAGLLAVLQDRAGPGAVGGAEVCGHPAGYPVDGFGRPVHLAQRRGCAQRREVQVLPGMVHDHVPCRGDVAGYRLVLVHRDADHGERRPDVVLRQQAQDLRRVDRARAVVDGERDRLGAVVDVVHRPVRGGRAFVAGAVAGRGARRAGPRCAGLAHAGQPGGRRARARTRGRRACARARDHGVSRGSGRGRAAGEQREAARRQQDPAIYARFGTHVGYSTGVSRGFSH